MTLVVKSSHIKKIQKHSEDVFPVEACGILAGFRTAGKRIVEEIYSTRNILNSPSAYRVDPEEQLKVFLLIEEGGLEVVGFYHSHPHWSATPSNTDLAQAYYPEHSFAIYSIPEQNLQSYFFAENRFMAEELTISDSAESKN